MNYNYLKNIFDKVFALFCIIVFFPVLLILFIIVKLSSKGPFIYWSDRVGIKSQIFKMPKIRTMKIETPQLATHLLSKPDLYLTPVGSFLRKSSLDELPQIWSVLRGHMSMIGPRPALFNQKKLIRSRAKYKIDNIRPGITGWAQVNGRDELDINEKVKLDLFYVRNYSLFLDLKIIFLTFLRFFKRNDILH